MSSLLKDQDQGSPLRGLPVDDMGDTSVVTAVTGETVQLYYSNAGTRTADAGQAAGTAVSGNTAFSGIQNKAGDTQATTRDSSLTFTSTAFTTLKILSYADMEAMDEMSFAERLAYVQSASSTVKLSANGDYCVDYRKGVLYGIKASTQSTLTSTAYNYQTHVSTATVAGTVAVSSVVPGTGATNLGKAEDAPAASGDVGVMALAVRNDAGTALAADGDYTAFQTDSSGRLRVIGSDASTQVDDAAFTPAVSSIGMIGGFADETGTDSVDEGDGGALRMTLNRRLITAADKLDDAAFGIGTDYTAVAGFLADETATDSVDEGDSGAARMTLNRRIITSSETTDDAAMETGTRPSIIGAIADETATDSVDEGDAGYVRMDLARNLRVTEGSLRGPGIPVIDSYQQIAINLAAGNDQVLVSSAANKQIWVYGVAFTVNVAGTVSFQDEDNTAITGIMQFGTTGGMAIAPSGNFGMPLWKLATDKDLEVDVVTSELDGTLTYALVSV